jgi:predicted DNA-binding transcriptional regulator YafY
MLQPDLFNEQYALEITDTLDYLHGSLGFVRADRLSAHVHVPGRTLRRIILHLREHGHPIMSSKAGYAYARTQAERDKHTSIARQRAISAIQNYAIGRGINTRDAAIDIAGMV